MIFAKYRNSMVAHTTPHRHKCSDVIVHTLSKQLIFQIKWKFVPSHNIIIFIDSENAFCYHSNLKVKFEHSTTISIERARCFYCIQFVRFVQKGENMRIHIDCRVRTHTHTHTHVSAHTHAHTITHSINSILKLMVTNKRNSYLS